jgi:hypothetical protein
VDFQVQADAVGHHLDVVVLLVADLERK